MADGRGRRNFSVGLHSAICGLGCLQLSWFLEAIGGREQWHGEIYSLVLDAFKELDMRPKILTYVSAKEGALTFGALRCLPFLCLACRRSPPELLDNVISLRQQTGQASSTLQHFNPSIITTVVLEPQESY
jgi:hypothetical protein